MCCPVCQPHPSVKLDECEQKLLEICFLIVFFPPLYWITQVKFMSIINLRCNYKIQTSCFVRFSLHSAGRLRSHWGVLWGVLQITLFFSPLSHNPLHLTLFILLALKLLNTYILTHTLTVTDLEPSQTPGETSSSCWWIFNSRCCSGSSAPLRERGMKSQGAPLQCTR